MYFGCFWKTKNYYLGSTINPTKVRHHTRPQGENKLRCPKNVVTNIFFEILQLSMSTKPILKEFFINYTHNKVVQLPNNVIVKGNYIF